MCSKENESATIGLSFQAQICWKHEIAEYFLVEYNSWWLLILILCIKPAVPDLIAHLGAAA